MTTPLLQPVISPILVGRDEYLSAIETLAASAKAGNGVTLLVSGEAGIGKSRLVAEARARFTQSPSGQVLLGHCFEHDAGLPYAPFVDLLHGLLAEQPDVLPQLLAAAPELVVLLPELAGRPELAAFPIDAKHDKRRIQEALIRTVATLAGEQPRMLVIEDIHWADGLTLELLQRLAHRAADMPLLLVVTWRDDEESEPLRHFLAAVDRGRAARELRLERLAPTIVEQMLRAIFGQPQPIRPEFLETIASLTDGNPYFIEEVITALIATGDIYRENGVWSRKDLTELRIPRSVVDAVQQRARGLSGPARRLLDLAAVAGQRFDVGILQELLALDDPTLLGAIRELVAARLIVDVSDEQAAFRHALTREAVYAALLARERRAHHLALAEAIERQHAASPEPHAADLSYHYHAAGAWEQCLTYARLAGERAGTLFAPASEITHLNRALDAVSGLGIEPPRDLYRQRALARVTLGQFELAGHDHDVALNLARAAGDREAEWQSLLDIGALWGGLDYDRSGEALQQALNLAREIGAPAIIAQSLVQLGSWQVNVEQIADAERSLDAALEIFEATGDRQRIAQTIDLLAIVADLGGDIRQMQDRFDRAIALYRETNDRHGLASALATVACIGSGAVFDAVYVPIGQTLDDAAGHAEEALEISRGIGWRSGEAYALMNLAFVYRQRGDFGRAIDIVRAGAAIADEIQHREWMSLATMQVEIFARDLLDTDQAMMHAEEALERARNSGSRHFSLLCAGELITTAIAAGRADRAADVSDGLDASLPFETVGQRRVWLARAALALAQGNPQRAIEITETLLSTGVPAPTESDTPAIAVLRGEAFATLGRADDAIRSLQAAAAGAEARGRLPPLLTIYEHLALLFDRERRTDEARAMVAAASEIIDVIAASLPDREDAARYRDRALARLPGQLAARQAPGNGPLTRRERDVARLVAQGLSNRDIAEALFVGERTVETHVGNILGKLGFTSRAQIAAWVATRDVPQMNGADEEPRRSALSS